MDHRQARESYLEAQVMAATPQKLRLMLIEGALRFARQAIQHWEAGDNDQALTSITRCRKIVSELLSSVRVDETDLTKRVASLYLFLFQHLTKAQLRRDAKLVEEAIDVLEVERATWQQVCKEVPHAPALTAEQTGSEPNKIIATTSGYPDAELQSGSISFDA